MDTHSTNNGLALACNFFYVYACIGVGCLLAAAGMYVPGGGAQLRQDTIFFLFLTGVTLVAPFVVLSSAKHLHVRLTSRRRLSFYAAFRRHAMSVIDGWLKVTRFRAEGALTFLFAATLFCLLLSMSELALSKYCVLAALSSPSMVMSGLMFFLSVLLGLVSAIAFVTTLLLMRNF